MSYDYVSEIISHKNLPCGYKLKKLSGILAQRESLTTKESCDDGAKSSVQLRARLIFIYKARA